MTLQGGFLMGAVHSIGPLATHERGLSSASSINSPFSTNHLSSVLHPDDVNVVLVRAVWIDRCEGLSATAGGTGASVAASALRLHVPRRASGSSISFSVLYSLVLRNAGRVGPLPGVVISDACWSEHIIRRAAGAVVPKLIVALVAAQIPLVLDL